MNSSNLADQSDEAGFGRRRFLAALGVAAGTVAFGSVAGPRTASAVPVGASKFSPLAQAVRVIDTREASGYRYERFGDNYVRVPINGLYGVPATATAIVATVTAVNRVGPNWLTVVPSGTQIGELIAQNRLSSVLNMAFYGDTVANLTQIKLAGGGVDLFSLGACDMILDVIGYYEPVSSAVREGRFVGLRSAMRAIDTRISTGRVGSGQTLEVDVSAYVPSDASTAVINLTATECAGPGYFTVFPFTSPSVPTASSLNVIAAGATRAAAVMVPVATQPNGRRHIKVFALTAAHLIVDVTGYFTSGRSAPSQVGLFVPADPVRILDSRDPGQIGRLWPGWTVEGGVPFPATSGGAAAALNVTGASSRGPGYLTIAAARQPLPGTSNVNFTAPGQVVPNHAITPLTVGYGFQVYASGGADVIVDYLGYYTGIPSASTTGAPSNPPPPPIAPDWVLRIPVLGVVSTVREGDPYSITNAGYSWHWSGTGYLGQAAHVAAFAHRTTHGGVFRNLHLLSGGDRFTLTAWDGREYTYEVVRRDLTSARPDDVLWATRTVAGSTFSLIACSEPDFSPTNLNYRIVVTGVMVGWRQT